MEKGKKNQNPTKKPPLKSFFSLWFNERRNPTALPKSQTVTPRNTLLNTFH